ncbi:MAG: vWA domain-containing protein [Alphaproteobacteria bacterium]
MEDARNPADEALPGGKLLANIMHFARALRAAGLPIGPGRVIEAVRAVECAGMGNRGDFYWALHSVFVSRRDQRELFDQAFHVFWRNPRILERMMSMLLPQLDIPGAEQGQELSKRVADALRGNQASDAEREIEKEPEITIDAVMTYSDRELLQKMDFETMSAVEIAEAKKRIRSMRLPIAEVPTRRHAPDRAGARIDMRATLRASLRAGGGDIPLKRREPRRRHPPLVILCDISGSMSRYSRMLLHFMHAVTNDRDRVFSFLFGTHLTNVTRHLRQRDVDVALERCGEAAGDWSGGTRIGQSLKDFNRQWSRRVLGQGALVLFISDGLDRDAGDGLAGEIERLHKSCRRLIWLNPLLRYQGFEPRSLGMRAILPHVDEFRPVHNLESLASLAAALSSPAPRRGEGMAKWQATLH